MLNWNLRSNKSAITVLVLLLVIATITMPVQIRPAAYNQRESSENGGTVSNNKKSSQNSDSLNPLTGFLEDVGPEEKTAEEDSAPGSGNTNKNNRLSNHPVENHILSIYVVFHRTLDQTLFSDLQLPDAIPDQGSAPSFDKIKSGSILDVVLGGNKGVTFFATNPDIPKDVNHTNPLFMHRIVEEWDTPGWKSVTKDTFGSAFNEFGAMSSIYHSDYTYKNWSPQDGDQVVPLFSTARAQRNIHLVRGADDAFIGILQYDMRLNDKVMRKLRNKIRKTRISFNSLRNRDLKEKMVNRGSTSARARWNQQARAIKMSKLHNSQVLDQQQQPTSNGGGGLFDIEVRPEAPPNSKCCIFYSIAYPMRELIDPEDPFTQKLLTLYNMHFFTKYTYSDLSRFAILDAFVIPFSEFNRLVPYLENVMRNGVRDGALTSKEARSKSLRQLEQALAFFLGMLGKKGYQYVMVGLRHEPVDKN